MPPTKCSRSPSTTLTQIPHLTPKTLHIPSSRVQKSWRPVSVPAQDRIKTLLLAIQSQTIASLQEPNAKRRKHLYKKPTGASRNAFDDDEEDNDVQAEAIQALMAKLVKAVPKMSFPPAGKSKGLRSATTTTNAKKGAIMAEMDIDLEATLKRTAVLRSQVMQATQASKLLKRQLQAEEKDLRKDRAELKVLQENWDRTEAARKGQEQGLHALAREVDEVDGGGDGQVVKMEENEDEGIHEQASTARSRLRRPKGGMGGLLSQAAMNEDEDMKGLADALRSHLASMRTNTAGLRGVRRELRRAEHQVGLWGLRHGVDV